MLDQLDPLFCFNAGHPVEIDCPQTAFYPFLAQFFPGRDLWPFIDIALDILLVLRKLEQRLKLVSFFLGREQQVA